jgi:PAS domain S-box-containing protein
MSEPDYSGLTDQFRLLVQEVEEYAIFLLDPEGHVVSWNPGAQRIKDYSAEEIIGEHFSTFYPEEDIQSGKPERALERAAQSGQWVDEGWRLRSDGSRFWARVTITALRDDGQLRGFAKVTRDLTGRREHELELKQRTEEAERETALLRLMQLVAETANQADRLEDALEEAIPAICERIGWPVGHVYWVRERRDPPLVPSGIWHLGDATRYDEFRSVTEAVDFQVGESLPGRVATTGEGAWIRDVTSDQNFVRAKRADNIGVKGAFAVPIRREGTLVAILEFFSSAPEERDDELLEAIESVGVQLSQVAEREAAYRSLRESEEKFRALTEQSLVGIGLLQNGVYQYVNPTFAGYFGYDPGELIGEPPEKIFRPEDLQRVREEMENRLEGKKAESHYTARGLTREGETIYLELYGRRIEYQGGPAIVGAALDVTERRRLEEELLRVQDAERQRLGQELHDAVGSLLTSAGIQISGVLRDHEDGGHFDPGALEDALSYVKEAGEEARAVAHGLSPVRLEAGLRSALEVLAEQAEARAGLRCSVEVRGPVPDLSKGDLSEETATQLYRIAQEALNNAMKHADAERIQVRLEREDTGDAGLVLTIQDNGQGIGDVSPAEGGIGMRTMRHRANLIGGTLTVEETGGGGTVVRCRVPPPAR